MHTKHKAPILMLVSCWRCLKRLEMLARLTQLLNFLTVVTQSQVTQPPCAELRRKTLRQNWEKGGIGCTSRLNLIWETRVW